MQIGIGILFCLFCAGIGAEMYSFGYKQHALYCFYGLVAGIVYVNVINIINNKPK